MALCRWDADLPREVQLRKRLRKESPFAEGHSACGSGGILYNWKLVLLTSLSLGSPVLPTCCATCLVGQPPWQARWRGPRVTSRPLLHPSGASKVTASGSHQTRFMARMAAGAPGTTSGRVRGHAGAECGPVAGAVTIPCEYASLGWARQGTPLLRPEGLRGEGTGERGTRGKGSAGGCVPDGEDPQWWGEEDHPHLG